VTKVVAALVLALGALPAAIAHADPSEPSVEDRKQPLANTDAETEYNRGVRARVAQDWTTAVDAFRGAITLRASFPEAWNELGYALRQQGRYAESIDAYYEALRLRTDFPEALEYLGEAYVQTGRLVDARHIVARLRVIDAARADKLATLIDAAR
jgi:Flp pilus assembly protein TadD